MGLWSIFRRIFSGSWWSQAGPQGPFGYSHKHPVLCHDPDGEQAYLDRLLCPNGHPFRYERIGSRRGRCPDPQRHLESGCIVDRYRLSCTGSEHHCDLYFDMYHLAYPDQPAPEGLSLLPDPMPPRSTRKIEALVAKIDRLVHSGAYEWALALAEETQAMAQRQFGDGHPAFALVLHARAAAYRAAGDREAAGSFYKQALEVRRAALGERHPLFAQSLTSLGNYHLHTGETEAAEPLYKQEIGRA